MAKNRKTEKNRCKTKFQNPQKQEKKNLARKNEKTKFSKQKACLNLTKTVACERDGQELFQLLRLFQRTGHIETSVALRLHVRFVRLDQGLVVRDFFEADPLGETI